MEFKVVLKEKIDYIETLLNEYMPKEEGRRNMNNCEVLFHSLET